MINVDGNVHGRNGWTMEDINPYGDFQGACDGAVPKAAETVATIQGFGDAQRSQRRHRDTETQRNQRIRWSWRRFLPFPLCSSAPLCRKNVLRGRSPPADLPEGPLDESLLAL
jgi:hypothetical protein